MESLVISLGVGVITYISTVVTLKQKVDEHRRNIDECKKSIKNCIERVDANSSNIVKLETQARLNITTKEVDGKYMSKELFRQYEKHIDARFDRLEDGQEKILKFIEDFSGVKTK